MAIKRVQVLHTVAKNRISDLQGELADAKEFIAINLQSQIDSLAEIKTRQDIQPDEIQNYRDDIVANKNAMQLIDKKINRMDKINHQTNVSCLSINAQTPREELAVLLDYLKHELEITKNSEARVFLTGVYEVMEAWKERLSLNEIHIEEDILIPLLDREEKYCDSLLLLSEYQVQYQGTSDIKTKKDIFINALGANFDHQLDAFIHRVMKDKTFISAEGAIVLDRIKEIYSLLNVKSKLITSEELEILNQLKQTIAKVIQDSQLPIDGKQLEEQLTGMMEDALPKLMQKSSKLSYDFKNIINTVCKYFDYPPPFVVTEITDHMKQSMHEFKQEFQTLVSNDTVENPMLTDSSSKKIN